MGFFDSLTGSNKTNPANAAMPYYQAIPGATAPYFQPYINAGQQVLPHMQNEFYNLVENPGQKLNKIGSEFQQSPGFKFALDQALGAVNRRNVAGGMGGSPMDQQQEMELATQLANQDYYNWLGGATGLYGQGLQGEQGIASGGLQAGTSMADMVANVLAQQGNTAFRGQQEQNNQRSNLLGGLAKGAGALAAFGGLDSLGGGLFNAFTGGGLGSNMYGGA